MRDLIVRAVGDQKRALVWWSVGLFAYAMLMVLTYPSTKEINFDPMEDGLKFFLGGADTLSTLEGYLTSQIFYLPLALGIYAVFLSARLISSEIQSGGMDFLMSHPLSRRRICLSKYLALVAIVCWLALIFATSLFAAGLMIDDELSAFVCLKVGVNLAPIVLFYGTVGFAGACFARRQTVLGVASAVTVSTWVLHGLAVSSDLLASIEKYTVYYWYATGKPFSDGLVPEHMALLLGLSGGLVIFGTLYFERRDI